VTLAATALSVNALLPVPSTRVIVLLPGFTTKTYFPTWGGPAITSLAGAGDYGCERPVPEQPVMAGVCQSNEGGAIGVNRKSEWSKSTRGGRNGLGISIDCAILKRNDVYGSRNRIGLQSNEKAVIIGCCDLSGTADVGDATARQVQCCRAIKESDVTSVQREGVHGRCAGNIHVPVGKVHTDRGTGCDDQVFKDQSITGAAEYCNRPGSIVDGSEQTTILLLDPTRISADAAFSMGRKYLKPLARDSVKDDDCVRLGVVRHGDDQRFLRLIGVDR